MHAIDVASPPKGGIAVKIKSRREALGLSQSQFAAALGVSVRTLQNWEGGAGAGQPRRVPRLSGMVERAIARLEADHAATFQNKAPGEA